MSSTVVSAVSASAVIRFAGLPVLKQRIGTAIVLSLTLLAAVFLLPSTAFALLSAAAFLVGVWEWSRLAHVSGGGRVLFTLGFAIIFMLCGWWIGFQRLPAEAVQSRIALLSALATLWWVFASWLVHSYPSHSSFWSRRWEQTLMGLLVIVPSWAALVFLRDQAGGEWLIIILVAAVVCADSGAYFVGRKWGRSKLAPQVSPGKSKEGFYGGFICSALFAVALVFAFGRGVQDWWLLALVVPASLASVVGDLLESMLKRQRGIKDSGSILPGHGGVLDRIDSITAAAPVFALAYALTGWTL